jgi:hypothetical protein
VPTSKPTHPGNRPNHSSDIEQAQIRLLLFAG